LLSTQNSLQPIRLIALAALGSSIALGHGLSPALAERADTTTNVEFPAGSSAKRLSGKIKGDQRARYILPGKAGHKLSVEISASNSRTFFSISPPGGVTDLFLGEDAGTLYEGKLPKTGDYLITVYLGRGPASEGAVSKYDLTIRDLGKTGSSSSSGRAPRGDDLAGGPDYWEVTNFDTPFYGLSSKPALGSPFVARVRKGTVLKNLGCERHNGDRWCRVQLRDDPRVEGWARGQYLREFNR
jgi:hypothetical protein